MRGVREGQRSFSSGCRCVLLLKRLFLGTLNVPVDMVGVLAAMFVACLSSEKPGLWGLVIGSDDLPLLLFHFLRE